MAPIAPEVLWAQRSNEQEAEKNLIYLTINVSELKPESIKLDIQPTKLDFAGTTVKGQEYAVELEFFEEIDPAETKKHISTRAIELALRKKEAKAEFWPRLLKEKKKYHFLRTDFDKWVDEDEQDPEEENPMAGMGGMGGDDPMANFDFSSLGGAGGMGGLGGDGPGAFDPSQIKSFGGAGGDDSDDDMPDLEENDTKEEDKTAEKK